MDLLSQINKLINNKEYSMALSLGKKELLNKPNDSAILFACGDICFKINNYQEASFYFGKACGINPNDYNAIAGSLRCALKNNNNVESDILFNRLKDDKSEYAYIAKSEYYNSKPNFNLDLNNLNDGYQIYPNSVEIIEKLIVAKERNNLDDPSINNLIAKGLSLSPNNEKLLSLKIKHLYKTGKYDECYKCCRSITVKYPSSAICQEAQILSKKVKKATVQTIVDNHDNNLNNNSKQENSEDAIKELDSLIGLQEVKEQIHIIKDSLDFEEKRAKSNGKKVENKGHHYFFLGNPGTGKTTVARLLGKIFKSYGLIEKGQLIETSRSELVSQYIGQTAKDTQKKIDEAMGGVLFVDEAYSMYGEGNDFGKEAVDTLIKAMEDHKGDFICVFAGYKDEMRKLLKSNPGFSSRIKEINFPDYNDDELLAIAEKMALKDGYSINEEGKKAFLIRINKLKVDEKFGNAREVRNLIQEAEETKAKLYKKNADNKLINIFTAADFGIDSIINPEDLIKQNLDDLNSLIGLEGAKKEVKSLINKVRYEKQAHQDDLSGNFTTSMNMIFAGNPGTGKTTVARIYAKILAGMGVLKKGDIIEATRSDFVAEYLGQSAPKTLQLCRKSYGGVLFIDEAYSLCRGRDDSFGLEAIDTLLKEMEDHRDKMVVILAGYSKEMKEFLNTNSGLESRIAKTVYFEDYTTDELYEIFKSYCVKNSFSTTNEFDQAIKKKIYYMYQNKTQNFGNAREIRKLYESTYQNMINRVIENDIPFEESRIFTVDDIND